MFENGQQWLKLFFLFPTGVIIFGSDQEVGELMQAIRRANMTGHFTWIGSDGWGARELAFKGNEPEVRPL